MASISMVTQSTLVSLGSKRMDVTRGVLINSHSVAFPIGALNQSFPPFSDIKTLAGRVPATIKSGSSGCWSICKI